MKLTITERVLLASYIMILPCFIVSLMFMNGDILLYSLGVCGIMVCINGVIEDNRSK